MTMKEYSDRLTYALNIRGVSQSELARATVVKPQAIQYLCGQGKRSVHSVKIAEVLGINAKWLTDGIGNINSNEPSLPTQLDNNITNHEPTYVLGGFDLWDDGTPLRDDEVALPFFREVELSAGSGRHEVIENHGRKLRFSKATLKSKSVDINDAACVTVSGNSMEPAMPDGATIGVDTSKKDISNGEIYAIDHDGDLRVKIVYRLPGGVIRLRSFNSDDWPDELYSVDDAAKIKIIGRVFWWSVLR